MFFDTYQDPQGRFTFGVPSGWKAQASDGGGAIVSNGDAYVSVMQVPGGGKNNQIIGRLINQIGSQWQRFHMDTRGDAKLGGKTGIYLMITGVNPKGVPATLRVVAAPFGDDAYMLLMSAPTGRFDNANSAFQKVEDSFAVGSSDRPERSDSDRAQANRGQSTHDGPIPERGAPKGMNSIDGADGGRLVYGTFPGASAAEVFQAGIARMRGYFDGTPTLLRAVKSKDGQTGMIVFRGSLKGYPVSGLAIASGASHFGVIFDNPEHLSKSPQPLMNRLSQINEDAVKSMHPKGGESGPDWARFEAKSKHVALKHTAFPDGTATIGVAPGFTTRQMDNGSFVATSDDGAAIRLYVPITLMNPRGSIYQMEQRLSHNAGGRGAPLPAGQILAPYDSDPIKAWRAVVSESARAQGGPDPNPRILRSTPLSAAPGFTGRLVSGKITLHGDPFVFTGALVVGPPPPADGGWFLQMTILGAPEQRAEADMPAMIAMQTSVRLDLKAIRGQTMRNIEAINRQTSSWLAANKAAGDAERDRRFESSMANARASRDAMDRSTAGFLHYINDTNVIQHNPTGARGTVDKNLASALENADPKNFTVVPVSQYVKGVDY